MYRTYTDYTTCSSIANTSNRERPPPHVSVYEHTIIHSSTQIHFDFGCATHTVIVLLVQALQIHQTAAVSPLCISVVTKPCIIVIKCRPCSNSITTYTYTAGALTVDAPLIHTHVSKTSRVALSQETALCVLLQFRVQ